MMKIDWTLIINHYEETVFPGSLDYMLESDHLLVENIRSDMIKELIREVKI